MLTNFFNRKGQGALEYLLIIGGAILLVAIVIGVLFNTSGDVEDTLDSSFDDFNNFVNDSMGDITGDESNPDTPECTADANCTGDQICTDGTCVDSEPDVPECVLDADCTDPQVCTSGSCVDPEVIDLCDGIGCADKCTGDIRSYDGSCSEGDCSYTTESCEYGCSLVNGKSECNLYPCDALRGSYKESSELALGLENYWSFDEIYNENIVCDLVGIRDGTAYKVGSVDGAIELKSNGYIDLGFELAVDQFYPITISFLMNDGGNNDKYVFSKTSKEGDIYSLFIGENSLYYLTDGVGRFLSFPYNYPGVWKHVALVLEQKYVRVYVNGSLVGEDVLPPLATDKFDGLLTFGSTSNGVIPSDFFKGQLDELKIFSEALTEAEIGSLYPTGIGRN
jgi:hypothetical protein